MFSHFFECRDSYDITGVQRHDRRVPVFLYPHRAIEQMY
jgi:hypothetical protein